MTRLRRAAIVAALTDKLHEQGSWSGETHVQKATFLLQEMLGVPLGLDYVLYLHGPFSFDLRDELTEMRADEVLEIVPQPPPYGPRLYTGEGAQQLRERFPKTLRRYGPQLDFVAQEFGKKGVTALERLATAFWVTENMGGAAHERARSLHALKPHISIDAAERAIQAVDEMAAHAPVARAV
jgi:hypothetical protein